MSVRNMPLENFDCEGDPITVALRWEKWKAVCRAYLRDKGIDDSSRKKAMLLQMGGLALQDIYYNRTWPSLSRTFLINNVFEIALNRLDKYFTPKNNVLYERYIFRSMIQNPREAFMRFLERIEKQSEKCKFTDPNAEIIDQIVYKCASYKLKEKIIAMNTEATIHKISAAAQALEAEQRPVSCSAACRNRIIDTLRQFYCQPDYDFLCVYDESKCCACGKLFRLNRSRSQFNHSELNMIPGRNVIASHNVIPSCSVNLSRYTTSSQNHIPSQNMIPTEYKIPVDTTIVKIEDDDTPANAKNLNVPSNFSVNSRANSKNNVPSSFSVNSREKSTNNVPSSFSVNSQAKQKNKVPSSCSVNSKAKPKNKVPSNFSINLRSRVQRDVPVVTTNIKIANKSLVKSSKAKVGRKVPAKSKKTNTGRKTSVKSKNIKKNKQTKKK